MPPIARDAFGFPIPTESPAATILLEETILKPGRDQFRETEINKVLGQGNSVAGDVRPILWLMGGGSGAGKSSILEKFREQGLIARDNVIHIDPDGFKEVIPEFNELVKRRDSRAAAMVHQESTLMARETFLRATTKRANIIFDTTLSDPANAHRLIAQARQHDYEIRIIAVTVSPKTAIKRVLERGEKTGRYVPVKSLLQTHKQFARVFGLYISRVDSAELWKTDCASDEPTRMIAWKKGGRLDVLIEAEYREFKASADLNEDANTPEEI